MSYEIVDETHGLVSWNKYDEKQDRGHGEGGKFGAERLGSNVIAQTCCPLEMYADVLGNSASTWRLCYILLVTRIFNKEDVEEAYRGVEVAFIKPGHVAYSEAIVWVIWISTHAIAVVMKNLFCLI